MPKGTSPGLHLPLASARGTPETRGLPLSAGATHQPSGGFHPHHPIQRTTLRPSHGRNPWHHQRHHRLHLRPLLSFHHHRHFLLQHQHQNLNQRKRTRGPTTTSRRRLDTRTHTPLNPCLEISRATSAISLAPSRTAPAPGLSYSINPSTVTNSSSCPDSVRATFVRHVARKISVPFGVYSFTPCSATVGDYAHSPTRTKGTQSINKFATHTLPSRNLSNA